MIHNATCQIAPSTKVLIEEPVGIVHNAECHIDARSCPEEKVLYDESGVTLADLNRIYPNWEQKMPFFVKVRWPKDPVPMDRVIRQAIITGMMFAVEELLKAKI
jgi:hypothetical protein